MCGNEETDEIQAFATRHRLRTRIDDDRTRVIPGKLGHIYGYDKGVLGVMVMPNPPRRQYWGYARTAAIQAAGIKRKRKISLEQGAKQIERLRASAGRAASAARTRQTCAMILSDVPQFNGSDSLGTVRAGLAQ